MPPLLRRTKSGLLPLGAAQRRPASLRPDVPAASADNAAAAVAGGRRGAADAVDVPASLLPADLDLSMEVVEWLKEIIIGMDDACAEELELWRGRGGGGGDGDGGSWSFSTKTVALAPRLAAAAAPPSRASANGGGGGGGGGSDGAGGSGGDDWETLVQRRHAACAVAGMAAALQRFYPDMAPERLTRHVHSAVYADELLDEADPALRRAMWALVPQDRRNWMAEDVTEQVLAAMGSLGRARMLGLRAKALAKEPALRTAALAGGGGALVLGAAGVPLGAVAGATTGVLAGVVPACFTFGLALPTFAMFGGFIGAFAGAIAGASAGLLGGGALGGLGYVYQRQVKAQLDTCVGGVASKLAVRLRRRPTPPLPPPATRHVKALL